MIPKTPRFRRPIHFKSEFEIKTANLRSLHRRDALKSLVPVPPSTENEQRSRGEALAKELTGLFWERARTYFSAPVGQISRGLVVGSSSSSVVPGNLSGIEVTDWNGGKDFGNPGGWLTQSISIDQPQNTTVRIHVLTGPSDLEDTDPVYAWSGHRVEFKFDFELPTDGTWAFGGFIPVYTGPNPSDWTVDMRCHYQLGLEASCEVCSWLWLHVADAATGEIYIDQNNLDLDRAIVPDKSFDCKWPHIVHEHDNQHGEGVGISGSAYLKAGKYTATIYLIFEHWARANAAGAAFITVDTLVQNPVMWASR